MNNKREIKKNTTRPSVNRKVESTNKNTIRKNNSAKIRSKAKNTKTSKTTRSSTLPPRDNTNLKNSHRPSVNKNIGQKTKKKQTKSHTKNSNKNISAQILSHNLNKNKKCEKNIASKGHVFKSMSIKTKRISLFVLFAILIIVIGVTIGIFTFMLSTNSKLAISEDAVAQLSSASENSPYYMLITADTDVNQDGIIDQMFIVHTNPSEKNIVCINVDVNTYIASSSGGGTTFAKINKEQGDSGLIKAASSFVESGICHYVKINADGIEKLINLTDGIEVELTEQFDDPTQASKYISAGTTTIDGQDALSILRSTNFNGGQTTISSNQNTILNGILINLFNKENNTAYLLDQVAGDLKTDMDTATCINFVKTYKNIDSENLKIKSLEGQKNIRNNEMVFIADSTKWKAIKQALSYGQNPPEEATKTINDINPSSFSIFVRNGSGIDGAAAMLSEKLKGMGYNVVGTDNAEQASYTETLIIYTDQKNKDNAEAVKNSINNGRVINGAGLYEINADVMIIIGKDYKV